MSLFPAYTGQKNDSETNQSKETNISGEGTTSWLTNSSFATLTENKIEKLDELSATDNESQASTTDSESKSSSSKKTKLEKKKKKREKKRTPEPPQLEFTGDEEYYVDKKAAKGYLNVNKLHKPACPRYNVNFPLIGYSRNRYEKSTKRYYTKSRSILEDEVNLIENCARLSEEEFASKNKEFNKKIAKTPKDVDIWIEYINHQDKIPAKLTKTQLAERKMEIIEKALIHNFGNDRLYKIYVEIVNSTFPSFEVSKFLDQLLAKDPTNCILWCGQILATQGSMARCVVPDVLKLYEDCMQKMYRKSQQDEIMLSKYLPT